MRARRVRQMSEKHIALARFYSPRRRSPVNDMIPEWNALHPEWAYATPTQVHNFRRDARQAIDRMAARHADAMARADRWIIVDDQGVERPEIVCLCGSTRFSEAFQQANLMETLDDKIVLTIGCDMKSDQELFAGKSEAELAEIKARLDALHRKKILLADTCFFLNVGGYMGTSTLSELAFALRHDKRIRFLESVGTVA